MIVTTPSASELYVVDSSGWVEYLRGGPKESAFAPYFGDAERILLPTIIVYEVHKKILREQGKSNADVFISQAFSFGTRIIDLDLDLSLAASAMSLDKSLPMADAVIYASAQRHGAQLVTSDSHFRGLPGVTVL
jgi:predicted nucleic acid-binding protein